MAVDRARRPGRRRRRGRAPGARSTPPPAACSVGLVEARDFASGTSSRSSKLIHGGLRYLEMLDFGLVARGAAGARAAAPDGSRRTWSGRCRSSTRCTHRGLGAASTSAPASRSTTRSGCSPGDARGRAAPPAPHPARRAADRAVAAQGRADRRDAVLRRPGRRRPAHDVPRPHRGGVRRARRQPGPGRRVPARGRAGHRRASCSDLETGRDHRGPGPAGRQRHRRVDRRHPGAGRRARPVPRAAPQGHPPRRAARPDPLRDRADPAHREVGAVRHPVGPALDHRHHRHRLVRWTRRTRRPARSDIDYLLDHVNTVLRDAADPRGRRGRLRRPAAAADRRVRGRPRSCPASTPSRTRCPAWSWSPAASTRRTG